MNMQKLRVPLARISSGLGRVWNEIEYAREVAHTRSQLGQLDDRMLQDLGISRAQAEFEASRAARRIGRRYH
jgi:uncharacterized protein YjiS (DUF1127 family)